MWGEGSTSFTPSTAAREPQGQQGQGKSGAVTQGWGMDTASLCAAFSRSHAMHYENMMVRNQKCPDTPLIPNPARTARLEQTKMPYQEKGSHISHVIQKSCYTYLYQHWVFFLREKCQCSLKLVFRHIKFHHLKRSGPSAQLTSG